MVGSQEICGRVWGRAQEQHSSPVHTEPLSRVRALGMSLGICGLGFVATGAGRNCQFSPGSMFLEVELWVKSEYMLALQVPNGFWQKPQHSAGSAEMDVFWVSCKCRTGAESGHSLTWRKSG